MNKNKGYVTFILHAHLPFIHHPESEDYLEEQWLFEAMSETYIPLLLNFKKLEEEGVKFRLTMTMTPPLLYMLDNKLLQERYIKYLKKHIELAEKELKRTTYDERLNSLSKYYFDRYSNDLHVFRDVYNCNLINGFKHFQDAGFLEIITCGAPFTPLTTSTTYAFTLSFTLYFSVGICSFAGIIPSSFPKSSTIIPVSAFCTIPDTISPFLSLNSPNTISLSASLSF